MTGASGFIGRHVTAAARARGHEPRLLAYSSRAPATRDAGEFLTHDLRRREGLTDLVRDVDVVIHCAALMSGREADQHAITVGGTANLLDAMDEARVTRLVLLSTFALYDYGGIRAGSVLTEDSPLDDGALDRAPYVRVKRQQEELVREHGRTHGSRATILRPGLVFGPGRTWFHHLGMRLSPRLWLGVAGRSVLPLAYVENCAEAIILAAETEAAVGATLNIVDDSLPERRAYVRALAATVRPAPTVVDLPWGFLGAGAAVATRINRTLLLGKAPLPDVLRKSSLAARCKPLTYSNVRAKNILGWRPRVFWTEALDRSRT